MPCAVYAGRPEKKIGRFHVMDNTPSYVVLSERTDVRTALYGIGFDLRIAAYEVRSHNHHVQTPANAEAPGGPKSLSSRPGLANIIPKGMRKCAGSSA